jgi:D-aspartate ligase
MFESQMLRSSPQIAPAVLVDIQSIAALQTARVLWSRGIPLIGIGSDPREPFCQSRVYSRKLFTTTTDERLIETLEALGPELPGRAPLFLAADESVLLVSRHRERLELWYHLALPADSIIQMLVDKTRFATFADANGLPIPRTLVLQDVEGAREASERLRYPVVIKPGVRAERWAAHTRAKAFPADSARDFLNLYARVSAWGGSVIAQEWIPGPETNLFSCNAYFNANGVPLATFVARKLRQWPPETGRSSLGVACRNDEVLDVTLRTFQAVGYCGPAYLEMKQDERDGRHWIIEPNVGRATGRSAIAEAGGVELLLTQYCDLLGLELPVERAQGTSDVKWIYLRWDLQAAAVGMARGRLSPRAWWRSVRGSKVFAAWHRQDPLPFLLDYWAPAARRIRRGIRSITGILKARSRASGRAVLPPRPAPVADRAARAPRHGP